MARPVSGYGETRDAVLEFIKSWISENGYAPSFYEIGDGCGITVSSASYHVARLERSGRLRRPPGKKRALVVVEEVDVGEV